MPLHITTHSGKLKGFQSLSTSTTNNKFCQRMNKIEGTVCNKCYAMKYESFRSSLRDHLISNSEILSKPLENKDLFITNSHYFRFNSFGELINKIHLDNLCKIALHNPNTSFSLYTKRIDLVKKLENKPDNLIIIASSPILNQCIEPGISAINKVFTVYNKQTDHEINCAQNCGSCLKCYLISDETYHISEKIK